MGPFSFESPVGGLSWDNCTQNVQKHQPAVFSFSALLKRCIQVKAVDYLILISLFQSQMTGNKTCKCKIYHNGNALWLSTFFLFQCLFVCFVTKMKNIGKIN